MNPQENPLENRIAPEIQPAVPEAPLTEAAAEANLSPEVIPGSPDPWNPTP